MGTLTGYDSAFPPAHPPTTDLVAFYGGGDTPHVWTLPEIEGQAARYRLPIWVRSNPSAAGVSVTTDVEHFVAYLKAIAAPEGSLTVLDLETAIAPNYVTVFGQLMYSEGYLVLPYGSSSTLFRNPKLYGYWVALPGAKQIPSNCVGVQYGQGGGGAWDNDWFLDSLPFWDTKPTPAPGPITEEEDMPYYVTSTAKVGYVIATDLSHKTSLATGADAQTLLNTKNYQQIALSDATINNIPGT